MLKLKYCTSKDSLSFPFTVELVLTQSTNWFKEFPYIQRHEKRDCDHVAASSCSLLPAIDDLAVSA